MSYSAACNAHPQDPLDNLYAVRFGCKVWTVCKMARSDFISVARELQSCAVLDYALGSDLRDPFAPDFRGHPEITALFHSFAMEPSDLLYNPSVVIHQVAALKKTVAGSVMFRRGNGSGQVWKMGEEVLGHQLV